MDQHLYKMIELVGSSTRSVEDAIQSAIGEAAKTLHNIRWFEVLETRGQVKDGQVAYYQVRIKLGFRVGEADFSIDDIAQPGTDPLHEGP